MEVLYVIGNGFDLWHGLPTKYTDFYKFIEGGLDELKKYIYFESNYRISLNVVGWHNIFKIQL